MNGRRSLIPFEPSSTRKSGDAHQQVHVLYTNGTLRVKLPKSFVAVNLSDAFSWEKQHSEEDTDEAGGLEMKLTQARVKEQDATAARNLVSSISEAVG